MADKKKADGVKEKKVRVSTVPKDETKEAKFLRLANKRVNKCRKALDQIGLLGSASYISTEDQRKKITTALEECLRFNLDRLNKQKASKSDFTL